MEKIIDNCYNRISLSNLSYDKIWVYAIYNSMNELIYMYYGKLKDIVSLSPFRTNPKYDEREIYTIVFITPCKDKIDAENRLSTAINNSELKGGTPPYNVYNRGYNDYYFIQCLENGKFYKSAQDVIKIFRVSQPALSCHLRGVSGYKHVKGLTFKYYNGDSPNEIELAGGYKWVKGDMGGYKTLPSDDIINRTDITEDEIESYINTLINRRYMTW